MQTQQTTQSEIKSRKVRRILKLEARAQKLQARYDKAMEKIEPLRRQRVIFVYGHNSAGITGRLSCRAAPGPLPAR